MTNWVPGGVNSVAFSPNGRVFATGGGDESVRLWAAHGGGERIRMSHGAYNNVHTTSFNADGTLLVTASERCFPSRELADGSTEFSGPEPGPARVWDTANGEEVRRFVHSKDGDVTTAAFSPDGSFVVTGGTDRTARLWSVNSGEEQRRLRHHRGLSFVHAVVFHPEWEFLATLNHTEDYRSSIWLWNFETGKRRQRIETVFHCTDILFSPDGDTIIGIADGKAYAWDAFSGEERIGKWFDELDYGNALPLKFPVNALAFSPDGELLAGGGPEGFAVWRARTGEKLCEMSRRRKHVVNDVAFGSKGDMVATAGTDGTARIWGVASGEEQQRVRVCRRAVDE